MRKEKVSIVINQGAQHQLEYARCLAAGLASIGIESEIGRIARHRVIACWGWRPGKIYRDQGKEVLVMERAYLGDRFHWLSLSWNGLNGRAVFNPVDDGGERFNRHFKMLPWDDSGDYILIMGQVPGDASLQGKALKPWYEAMAIEASKIYGIPVRFRQHPVATKRGISERPKYASAIGGSLEDAIAGAKLVITYNSNSGVDSVIAGKPTFAFDRGSMAWDVTSHEVGKILMPNRDSWASKLAWCQWLPEEISDGSAVKHILDVNPVAKKLLHA